MAAIRLTSVDQLERWGEGHEAGDFPYVAIVDEFHAVGKQFVPPDVLEQLAEVRATLPWAVSGTSDDVRTLEKFLDIALDKWDGRYDYVSYLALDVLALSSPRVGAGTRSAPGGRSERLVVQLVADAMAFELTAIDDGGTWLPELQPSLETIAKRCRLGLRALMPGLLRRELTPDFVAAGVVPAAREICRIVDDDLLDDERRALQLSMLPVYVVHDEHMFIRILQAFEATFALMADDLRSAALALTDGDAQSALQGVTAAEQRLEESTPLFSLLATMDVEAFRVFRGYTDGASAIQSRNYKTVESLCAVPETSRTDSIAYRAVPEVREAVLRGRASIDDAFVAARREGSLTPAQCDVQELAMKSFTTALFQWRQTHYRIAVRMLGERPGTGYTEGTPYLKSVRTIPVFRSIDDGQEA